MSAQKRLRQIIVLMSFLIGGMLIFALGTLALQASLYETNDTMANSDSGITAASYQNSGDNVERDVVLEISPNDLTPPIELDPLQFAINAPDNSLQLNAYGYSSTPAPVVNALGDTWYLTTNGEGDWNLPFFQPGTQSGTANWTISNDRFVSHYPRGFEFSTVVSSDKGDIVSASVIWSHVPNELKRREADVNSETGRVRYRWFLDDSLPPWVAVNYYWSFMDSAGNRFRTNWIVGNEYSIDDGWTRTESDEVIVFVQDGLPLQTAEIVVEAMNAQQETFLEAWGQPLSFKPRVILFADKEDFGEWRLFVTNPAIVGQTDEEWGATVQVMDSSELLGLAYGTVLHEIAHLYQLDVVGEFEAGTWWNEGNATYFELNQFYDYENRVRHLASDDQLPILLLGPGPSPIGLGTDNRSRLGYDVGYTFWRWLITTYGLDTHLQIAQQMAAGESRDEALTNVLGIDLATIETTWREWLGADGPAPTLNPTPTHPAFPTAPAPLGFSTQPAN